MLCFPCLLANYGAAKVIVKSFRSQKVFINNSIDFVDIIRSFINITTKLFVLIVTSQKKKYLQYWFLSSNKHSIKKYKKMLSYFDMMKIHSTKTASQI